MKNLGLILLPDRFKGFSFYNVGFGEGHKIFDLGQQTNLSWAELIHWAETQQVDRLLFLPSDVPLNPQWNEMLHQWRHGALVWVNRCHVMTGGQGRLSAVSESLQFAWPCGVAVDSLRQFLEKEDVPLALLAQAQECRWIDFVSLWSQAGLPFSLVEGEKMSVEHRTGFGYDVHPLEEGRELVLAGVHIDHSKGLAGHSDADVVAHVVADALLAAANQGDIGTLFPAGDQTYLNADSMKLLEQVVARLSNIPAKPVHLSVVLHAQKPKLAPYHDQMVANLQKVIGCTVNLTFKNGEGIGSVGAEQAMKAFATADIELVKFS